MLAVTLPIWLNAENLRTIVLVTVVVLIVFAYFVTRIITAIVLRVAMLVVIVGIGALFWSQRATLGECIETTDCNCSVAGVQVPLPTQLREICESRGR